MPEGDIAYEFEQAPARTRGRARIRRGNLDLFHWNDLPEYLKDNEFIVTGYRANTGLWGSLTSLFRLHNESGNIWTHLCGTPLSSDWSQGLSGGWLACSDTYVLSWCVASLRFL
jgi:hypothetical protein